jgi:hypothetical protein
MSDDICNESFNVTAVQVTAHEGAGVRHQRMVRRRGQSCNTSTTQRTLPDQVRAWDAVRRCFGVQPRQVVTGDIDLDFGHSVVPIEAEHRQKAAS